MGTNFLTKREVGSGELEEARPAEEGCQVSRLSLSFSLLGWDRWIISPPGFSPGQCSGLCQSPVRSQSHFAGELLTPSFPFSNSSQTSNHARILRILRSLGHPEVTGPHCVPSSLGPLPLLHHDKAGTVTLSLYQDMIVTACACQ